MIEIAPISKFRMTYNEAWLYCLTLTYNGHKDWRMPTESEYHNYDEISHDSWDEADDSKSNRTLFYIVPVRDV